ncbi:Noc2p family-domain-containing protein [Spinellus fusiger]|nr:Noc2p family-domain-containing protein [Spinellus fusiger]
MTNNENDAIDRDLEALEQVNVVEDDSESEQEEIVEKPKKPVNKPAPTPKKSNKEPNKMEEDSEDEVLDLEDDEDEDEDELLELENDEDEDSGDELIELEPEEEASEEEASEEESDDDMDNDKKIKKDAIKHKEELEELKKRDPEFYSYLEKEGADLLDFDMSDDEEEEEEEKEEGEEEGGEEEEEDSDMADFDEIDSEDEETGGRKKKMSIKEQNDNATVLTKETVNSWIQQVESTNNIKIFKKMLSGFKSAARMSDEEQQENVTFEYKIVNPSVLNKIIIATMRLAPIVFTANLKSKKDSSLPSGASKWNYLKSLVKSYLNNMLYLLRNLTDSSMHYVAIREAEKCTKYWACFGKIAKEYLKALLNLWSSPSSSDHVRIQSFLAIRSLAVSPIKVKNSNENFLDLCLKSIYLTFVRSCKTTNIHTLPAINLMRNLAVELYGIQQTLSYQQAFAYIRQLAVNLRGGMQLKTKESYKVVYNWQFVHCIDFWANVLSTHCQPKEGEEASPLTALIFPLVQVALGTVRLIPTAQYFPLRFHVLRSMISLGQSTGVFIPLAPYLFEVFESGDVKNKSNPSTLKALEWEIHLKAPKQYLHTRIYQDGILEQTSDCLSNYYKGFFQHVSFAEMVIPGIVAIKRFVKKSKNPKGSKLLHTLAQKLENRSKFIIMQRSKIDLSPADMPHGLLSENTHI